MATIVIGSRNEGKIREIRELLRTAGVEIATLGEFPDAPEVIEDGATLEENALKKALQVYAFTHLPVVADDSGLEVFGLGMQPGVYSARYAGENVTYEDNYTKLLAEMKHIPPGGRGAQFRSVLAFADRDMTRTFEGLCPGSIAASPRGSGGFGYDPVFIPDGYAQTFAELPLEVKNRMSHRAKAFALLKSFLFGRYGPA